MSECTTKCSMCDKRGLPILLTRYTVAPVNANACRVGGNFSVSNNVSLGEHAIYTQRLLRSGYLYVFDENQNRWEAYFISPHAFLMPIALPTANQVRPAFTGKPEDIKPCSRNATATVAGCITINDPEKSGMVWLGFSDVEWTPSVLTKHHDKSYREKHMRAFDVKSWLASTTHTHSAKIDQVATLVSEFRPLVPPNAFTFSPVLMTMRLGSQSARSLIQNCEQMMPGKGAIVALDDPAGLVMDLAGLMEAKKQEFMSVENDAKAHFSASTIATTEASIKQQAMFSEIYWGEELARREEAGPGAWNPNPALAGVPGDIRRAEQWRTHTTASLERAANNAWRKYTHDANGRARFDADASREWLSNYDKKLLSFDEAYIAPLANAHVAWMQHACLTAQMTCNFDEADRNSGVAYTRLTAALLALTADKQPSYELYLSWLKNGEFAASNLVMRALAFNQQELINRIAQADAAPVDGRAFPSDAVIASIGTYMENMPASANAQLTALLAGLSGPALKYWDDFNAGNVGTKAAATMAAVTGKQFVRLPINGNRGQFIQAYVRQLFLLDPNLRTNANQLQKAIAAQVRLLEIQGVPTQSRSRLGWYVILDREVVAGATTKNLHGQALANELAQAVRSPQDIRKIDLQRAVQLRGQVATGATVLSGILMVWNYTKLLEDVKNSMAHEKKEAMGKLIAGSFAIGGFVAEQVGNGLARLGETRLRNMMGRTGAYAPRALQAIGRFAGFGVGLVLGFWDIWKGVEAAKSGKVGLTRAYIASGIAGIGVASTLFLVSMNIIALSPIGWIALAIGVVIWLIATLFIETNKDNKLQEWLARCHFGTGPEKYPNTATHIEQYSLALAE